MIHEDPFHQHRVAGDWVIFRRYQFSNRFAETVRGNSLARLAYYNVLATHYGGSCKRTDYASLGIK